jgi:ABC-type phosphate/phosphonate transport system substrate-binding protein
LAYDGNLGLPDSVMADLSIAPVAFRDVAGMVAAFCDGDADACFASAAVDCSFGGVAHQRVAQATVAGAPALRSTLLVRHDATSEVPAQLVDGWIGCIDAFCTTSYWAPMITLLDETRPGTALAFRRSRGFDDLLGAVIEGRTEAAMVWDRVLDRYPGAAARTRALAVSDPLPAPLLYARADLAPRATDTLRRAFLAARAGRGSWFDGFREPDHGLVETFGRSAGAVRRHFSLTPIQI